MKSLLQEYNALITDSTAALTIAEVLDPSVVASKLEAFGVFHTSVTGKKRDIIDAYLLLHRSEEEIMMLKQECCNVVTFYEDQRHIMLKAVSYTHLTLPTKA